MISSNWYKINHRNMKRSLLLLALLSSTIVWSQKREKDDEDKKEESNGFKKENLFTGGSVSLAFYNNTFLIGASPVFGCSLTNWIDAGVVANYNYTSYRDISGYGFNDKLKQYVWGGGAFLKIYPVRFLFVQAQFEHNFIKQRYLPGGTGGTAESIKYDANSFLVGGGYTTGRYGKGGEPFYYLAVLFDVIGDEKSPYTDGLGRVIPIIRGGIQLPLFQKGFRNYERNDRREDMRRRR
jgi:hypothetical protein